MIFFVAADLEACWEFFVFGVPAKTSATVMKIRGCFSFRRSESWMIWVGVNFGLVEKKLELFLENIFSVRFQHSADDLDLEWMLASAAKVNVGYADGALSRSVLDDIEEIANTKRIMEEEGVKNLCGSVVIFLGTLQGKYWWKVNVGLVRENDTEGLTKILGVAEERGFSVVLR
jgi:hypothetical protein